MKKRICLWILFFCVIIAGLFCIIQYKRPKEYFVLEDAIMMCDSSGEKTIEVTCELYLRRYFFKGSKVCGNIYVNGEKYISNYDLEQYERFWTYADDGFSAKLDGKKYIGTFLKENYWTNTDDGRRRDLFRGEQSIQQVLLFPEEKIIAFRLYDDKGENTLYLGPAGNAAEYKETERKSYEAATTSQER